MRKYGKIPFVTVLVLIITAVLCFTGCSLSQNSHSNKVIFASHADATAYTGLLVKGIENRLQSQGLELEFVNSNRDANLQIDQMNEAIAQNPTAIVLLPVDPLTLIQPVEKANSAGIPVIVASRDLNGGKFAQVKSDERQAGNLQGEYMAKHLPPNAKIVYLMGESSQSSAIERWEGFKEACLDKRPDIELLARADAAWSEAEGLKNMTLWLQMFPQIDALVGANDTMTLGAMEAVKAANRLNGMAISGVDAKDAAVKAVAAGQMSQTIKQDADKAAEAICILISEAAKGNIPTDNIKVPFQEITRDNVSQFVK